MISHYSKDSYHTLRKRYLKNIKFSIIYCNKKERGQDKEMSKKRNKNGDDINKLYFDLLKLL